MELLLLTLTIAVLFLSAIVFWLLRRQEPKGAGDNQALLMLQNQLAEMARVLDSKLGESARIMQSQFNESAKIIREITKELVRVGEGQKQVIGVTEQLKNLQDILKNPKQRGVLGEYYLETVLQNVLPPGAYKMQHQFKNGETVDAVVIVGSRIIPVDSKFSLENYNRMLEASAESDRARYERAFIADIKTRIDETAKYVRPEEGTMEFAFMFIPSEAVYYDLLINKVGAVERDTNNLIAYAWKRGVIIVSPTSFLAYLQTVLQGLRALQIEESAKEIRKRVEELGRHILNYESYFKKLGMHLGTTVGMYNAAYKELAKIDKDVSRISGTSGGIEPVVLERPQEE
jgi:DNA recombination protein RmuC